MDSIAKTDSKINELDAFLKNFFIYFYMESANGTEWIDYDLPTPSVLQHTIHGIFIGWALDGYFGTKEGQAFLNDVIARYLITFRDLKTERLPHKPQKRYINDKTHLDLRTHKLKEFQGLKSIARASKVSHTRNSDVKKDHVFWAIKFFCEDLIISQGVPMFSQLIDFAKQHFSYKEFSTLRAKCRSIFNWYEERDFELPKRKDRTPWEEDRVRRTENAKKVSAEKAQKNRAKVLGAITELQHLNKKITGVAIQQITGQNIKTCRKYLKEWKQEQEK